MLRALEEAGYSDTRSRRAVVSAIAETTTEVTPWELLERGRAHHASLGIVTVYRTLEILLRLGLIRKLHSDASCHTYLPATYDHGHAVICSRCQRATEFEGCDIGGMLAFVERQTGYSVQEHWLELFGLCPACRQEAQNA